MFSMYFEYNFCQLNVNLGDDIFFSQRAIFLVGIKKIMHHAISSTDRGSDESQRPYLE